jgi:dTDP-4-dehydrorhamnose 3,5-epimerase-like enzyme
MKNTEYSNKVSNGEFPEERKVSLDTPFTDVRGTIQNILLSPINSVAIITSKAGSVRSNHFHKTDWHYLYVISGSMEYYERHVDEASSNNKLIINAGEMVFTPPMYVHKTVFLQDTVLLSLAKNIRDHKHHEEDVVRVEF